MKYTYPELKPETGWARGGIKQGLKSGNWVGFRFLAVMQYEDMMEFNFGNWGDTINYSTDPLTNELVVEGIGFKSVNVGKTRVSGIEFKLTGTGKISKDLNLNILAGYTYMNTKSLEPNVVYYENSYFLSNEGILIGSNTEYLTYNNSSSDTSVLKYRYKHVAKCDVEIYYKKYSLGTSFRYNDFMKNIDLVQIR